MRRHLSFRSGNPALSSKVFADLSKSSSNVMTLDGTVNKTALSLFILIAAGVFTFKSGNTMWIWPGFIGGFIVALITIFKKHWAPITVPIYALLEGLALGGISIWYTNSPMLGYEGIVQQAIILTVGIFVALLFAYKTRIIRATQNFKLGVFAATGGIAIFYIVHLVVSLFGGEGLFFLNPESAKYGSLLSIGISLFIVVIASLNLVLDFDFIEQGAEQGAPKYMEWYGAFGLLVTLVWLYLEILRLLSKLNRR